MSIILASVVLMYGTTFRGDPEVRMVLTLATLFLVIGLTFGSLMTGVKLDFRDMQIGETLMWGGMAIGLIVILNRVVPVSFEVTSPVNQRWLSVLMGVSEECFFRVFLCGVGSLFSKWGGIIGSSMIWTPYHIQRYAYTGNLSTFILIFLVGLGLGWIYLSSKLGDGVIFAHGFTNYLASNEQTKQATESVILEILGNLAL